MSPPAGDLDGMIEYGERHVDDVRSGDKPTTARPERDPAYGVGIGDRVGLFSEEHGTFAVATVAEVIRGKASAIAGLTFEGHRNYASDQEFYNHIGSHYDAAVFPNDEMAVVVLADIEEHRDV